MSLRWFLAISALVAVPAAAAEKTAEEVFKNVKILKGVSRTEFLDTMRYMSAALGESCDGCHVVKDGHLVADLDDKKEKQTARKMITMTLAINKDHFEGHPEVGCATCHHGREHPDRFPPMEFGAPAAHPRMEKAPAGVTAEQLIARYVERLGGESAIQKLATRVERGTLTRENGPPAPVEVIRRAPGQYALSVAFPNGAMTQVFDGNEGWFVAGGLREANGLELERLRRDGEFFPALNIRQTYPSAMLAGIDKIGERPAYVIAGRGANVVERFYFDTETGLLVRRVAVHRTLVGDMPEQTDYADYRGVDGVEVPFRVTRQEVAARWIEHYDEVKFGVPADDARFQKPHPSSAEPRP